MQKINNNRNLITVADDSIVKTERQIGKFEQILSMLPFKFQSQKPVIAVLSLNGIIGKVSNLKSGLCLHSLNELIEKAFAISKLRAICLSINSPGGSPVQSELIAKRITSLAKSKKIPVYSFVEDVAASGGYWLACAGDEIYASKSSIIGSIGVISSSFGFHEAINKLGVERRVYTEGQNKAILDPFQPVKAADIKIIKQLQQQIHQHFIDYVKERRAGKLTQSDDILFNGEFWAGESAHDFGLIDGIADMHSFINNKFGDDIKIEYIASKQSWLKKKLGMANNNNLHEIADYFLDAIEHKVLYKKFDLY
ncbi:S49 family peptidase [Candidatus Trichorickettsia mobilis]|uniref:S49 family peptidase n=1 Tax=Candidatus Trichorickettsia mobilis TaxID=1346319 RepID=A0ABZ0UQJ7_9RICK|nr:S49 family peptidase [Candidatus Trichorickettsia mobilis]WPY00315.1 S49 family peptidase [Candidatus Trichorickettsia mobilis]